MPSKIRVLDELTINKIAAGEVIENPSSVVKELLENSIDAGSTEISIEIKGGGRQLIRISDNGSGMSSDDALLCLERHATSKLKDIEDIHTLLTMGFRGEAIPSIASISKFMILTSPGKDEGTMVIVDGGKIIQCSPALKSKGTTIEVKSLFFNVPARKKFQRSPNYDAAEILKVVSAQALNHPEIHFVLTHNDETMLRTNKEGDLKERVISVLGTEYFAGLCPISHEKGDLHIKGFIGEPSFTRHNRTGQYLFINSRAVFSPQVNFAIKEGYGTSLGDARHPVYVLHLELPGSYVDVNVHPQKKEVRIRQDLALKEFISEAIDKALEGTRITYSAPTIDLPKIVPTFSFKRPEAPAPIVVPPKETVSQKPLDLFTEEMKVEIPRVEVPRVVSTIKDYVILESQNLTLLDQRAAHERVIFEKLLKTSREQEIQALLIPHTLDVTPVEREALKERLPMFHSVGIQIEEFGQNSFIIQAVPQIFSHMDIPRLVHDILQQDSHVLKAEKERIIAQAASRASVARNSRLSIPEAQSLVSQLMKCDKPYQCPQGRPTIIEIGHEEIAKQFQK